MLIKVLGLLTFSNARLQYSLFKVFFGRFSKQTQNLAVERANAMEMFFWEQEKNRF